MYMFNEIKAGIALHHKCICLMKFKQKLFILIEGVTLQEKISKENILICVIQVDSCPFHIV